MHRIFINMVLSIFSLGQFRQADILPSTPMDLVTPSMTNDTHGPGKRVRQVAPEYEDTNVYHALYLPLDWKPGGSFPVIVEYTGNKWAPCNSTGEVKDANLGYGISGGYGFIWVSMPYIEKGRQENAVIWWGDKQATVDYRNRARAWIDSVINIDDNHSK